MPRLLEWLVSTGLMATIGLGADLATPGRRAPDLAGVHWIAGEPLDHFESGRVYVLEFWSTWCGACVESIESMNAVAERHAGAATFAAIHVWQRDAAPTPEEFLGRRRSTSQPVMQFNVGVDSSGAVASAWLDATQTAGLPVAMIVDQAGRLAWFGPPHDVERPLDQVIGQTYDLERGVAEMERSIRVARMANESDQAISNGDFQGGIERILEAYRDDPDTVAVWLPSTCGHLLARSGSRAQAQNFVNRVLACDAGRRPDVLAGLANVLLHFEPAELADLDLALSLARRAKACDAPGSVRAAILIARIQAKQGDVAGARREIEAAIAAASDAAARDQLAQALGALDAPKP